MDMRAIRITSFILTFCWGSAVLGQGISSADRDYADLRNRAFVAYNPNYKELRVDRIRRATSLGTHVYELETQGHSVTCAHQILTEIKWLLSATADFRRIDERLDSHEDALHHPERDEITKRQGRPMAVGADAIRNGSLD